MRDHPLHRRLTRLAEKTASANNLEPGGWWVGDVAGKRRDRDDREAGRLAWRDAHNSALQGLKAFRGGDQEMAQIYAWAATDHYIAALEAAIRPQDMQALGRSAQRRGRPQKNSRPDRN